MPQQITLYPIYALASDHEDFPFDTASLPYQITEDVALEDVTTLFNAHTWEWVGNELGHRDIQELRGVHHALVHRYAVPEYQHGDDASTRSKGLMHMLAALLRLIRPMRQIALLMQGGVQEDNTMNVQHFEHPIGLMNVPQVQKQFHSRTQVPKRVDALAPR